MNFDYLKRRSKLVMYISFFTTSIWTLGHFAQLLTFQSSSFCIPKHHYYRYFSYSSISYYYPFSAEHIKPMFLFYIKVTNISPPKINRHKGRMIFSEMFVTCLLNITVTETYIDMFFSYHISIFQLRLSLASSLSCFFLFTVNVS